jgi:hypothetical protein
MALIQRETLLQILDSVEPGLAPREVIEQSSCFVFLGDRVITFNDEVACQHEINLEVEGAVPAAPLQALLRKLDEDELNIELTEDTESAYLSVNGKGRSAGLRLIREIALPFKRVEKPGNWQPLPDKFAEAVDIAGTCAGKDASAFWVSCIHIHPRWVEACDGFQAARYKIKTGVPTQVLVRAHAIKNVVPLGMTEFSFTPAWMHFRNPAGLIMSVRCYSEEYKDIGRFFDCTGAPMTLPKGLAEAAEKAEIFGSDNIKNPSVSIEMKPGRLRIRGSGTMGYYSEVKQIQYDGAPITFTIAPKLLQAIVQRHSECEILEERLKVDGGSFVYVTSLGVASEV